MSSESESSDRESGKLVYPGQRLGVIEEFIADTGTYVKKGIIYSSIVGRALLDLLNKRVSVYPLGNKVKVPKTGNIILGQVTRIQKQNAFVCIYMLNKSELSDCFPGLLHISDVESRYTDSIFYVCRPGDILRGRVVSEKNGFYHLSTKDKDLGVIYAFCSQCGHLMDFQRSKLRCSKCGRFEQRMTASDYGKAAM